MSLDLAHYPTLALANTPEELRTLPKDHDGHVLTMEMPT